MNWRLPSIASLLASAILLCADEPRIEGSPKFQEQVKAALALLREKAPDAYPVVTAHIGRIVEGKHSGMWAYQTPPTYEMNGRTAFHSVAWCAASIAHDAFHSRLYHDHRRKHGGRVPDAVWTGDAAEKQCIAFQLEVMKRIGSPEHDIQYVEKQSGGHHDVNHDGKYDWKDYDRRNW